MKSVRVLPIFILLFGITAGCASDNRYYTQKGAVIGGLLGAGSGQAIGRDTESTLLGTALGGLAGAVLGNYYDQCIRYPRNHIAPAYRSDLVTYPVTGPNSFYSRGQWITVPAQYVSGHYVPAHQVWVGSERIKGIVVQRR